MAVKKKNKKSVCLCGTYILVGRQKIYKKNKVWEQKAAEEKNEAGKGVTQI